MTAIVTNKFRLHNAKAFKQAAANAINNYYVFIGKPQAWADDLIPSLPHDNVSNDSDIWHDMIALKKINDADMSYGIHKRTWQTGLHYDMFRHDYDGVITGVALNGGTTTPASLAEANYYVITANFGVYVCLNNNAGGASTIDPSSISMTNNIGTGTDSYTWKFIARCSGADSAKFSTTDYHPVKTVAANPGAGDPYLDQWNQQVYTSANEAGAVYVSKVLAGGSGYGTGTGLAIVTIIGDGTGATATADANGAITKINMTAFGSGYTWAKAIIAGTGTNATVLPIITPPEGLGTDPVTLLNAFNIVTNFRFEYADGAGDFPVTNDYRRIGIIVDPLQYGSATKLSATTASATYVLTMTAVSAWTPDMVVEDTTTHAKGRVVDWDSATKRLRIIRTSEEGQLNSGQGANQSFVVGHTVQSGAVTGVIDTGGVTMPAVQPNSGSIIYIENRRPIMRSVDQIEDIKVIYEF